MLTKRDYFHWKAHVIRLFYEPMARATRAVPVDGAPAVLMRHKFLLVALPDPALPNQVALGSQGPDGKTIA